MKSGPMLDWLYGGVGISVEVCQICKNWVSRCECEPTGKPLALRIAELEAENKRLQSEKQGAALADAKEIKFLRSKVTCLGTELEAAEAKLAAAVAAIDLTTQILEDALAQIEQKPEVQG